MGQWTTTIFLEVFTQARALYLEPKHSFFHCKQGEVVRREFLFKGDAALGGKANILAQVWFLILSGNTRIFSKSSMSGLLPAPGWLRPCTKLLGRQRQDVFPKWKLNSSQVMRGPSRARCLNHFSLPPLPPGATGTNFPSPELTAILMRDLKHGGKKKTVRGCSNPKL